MNTITTRFGIGDIVVRIWIKNVCEWVTCPKCTGRGFHMFDNGEKRICDCSYGGDHPGRVSHYTPTAWMIDEMSYQINSVRVQTFLTGPPEIHYPTCSDSENTSGTYHKDADCFATKEEALEECSRRNEKEQIEKLAIADKEAKKKAKKR